MKDFSNAIAFNKLSHKRKLLSIEAEFPNQYSLIEKENLIEGFLEEKSGPIVDKISLKVIEY